MLRSRGCSTAEHIEGAVRAIESLIIASQEGSIAPGSRSYPYLALAQRLGIDYGLVLTEAHYQEFVLGLAPSMPTGMSRLAEVKRVADWSRTSAEVRAAVMEEHEDRRTNPRRQP